MYIDACFMAGTFKDPEHVTDSKADKNSCFIELTF
jgi:hypothetical protein